MITAEDLDRPPLGEHDCTGCGLEIWGCVCNPAQPFRKPTEAELEAARRERLSRAERARS